MVYSKYFVELKFVQYDFVLIHEKYKIIYFHLPYCDGLFMRYHTRGVLIDLYAIRWYME